MNHAYAAEDVAKLVQAIYEAVGVAADHARTTARHLVLADLRGVMTHGLMRVPSYIKRLRSGDCVVGANPEVVSDRGAVQVVDGHHGIGQVAGDFAMRRSIERAGELGVGVTAVRRGGHYGAVGGYMLMATEANLIGIGMTNAPPLMAPTGGTDRRLGNNPLAIGVPTTTGPPLVLDIAMSVVSAGAIKMAAERNKPIPEAWGLDRAGQPTTDANEVFFEGGLLRPIADHKGYGLSFMVEVLAGVLSGGGVASDLRRLDQTGASDASHLFIALNIANFMDLDEFAQRLSSLADHVRESPKANGVDQILLPGQREGDMEAERRRLGIPYPTDIIEPVTTLAKEFGIEPPTPFSTGGSA